MHAGAGLSRARGWAARRGLFYVRRRPGLGLPYQAVRLADHVRAERDDPSLQACIQPPAPIPVDPSFSWSYASVPPPPLRCDDTSGIEPADRGGDHVEGGMEPWQ